MRAISLPFRTDGYGRVATTTDPVRIWADRARTVVSTQPGERVMRPTFGCPMPARLFDAMESVPGIVETDVAKAFEKWLPDLLFDSISVDYEAEEDGEVALTIAYDIPTIQSESGARYSIVI